MLISPCTKTENEHASIGEPSPNTTTLTKRNLSPTKRRSSDLFVRRMHIPWTLGGGGEDMFAK